MKEVSRDQGFQLMAVLQCNADWSQVPTEVVQQIIDDPTGSGREFTKFLLNGGQVQAGLSVWKTISIGGVDIHGLQKQLKDGDFYVSDWAKDIMSKPEFTTLTEPTEIHLARVRVKDLGFKKEPTTAELFARIKEVGDLCPAEVGPYLRLDLKDQPKGDWFWVAMEPIAGSGGDPRIFYFLRIGDGLRWLHASCARPDGQWRLGVEVVFRLRK